MKRMMLLLLVALAGMQVGKAQKKPPFWKDVQTIKYYDEMYAPPAEPIVFTGSSSIRKWDDLERTFAGYEAMNRGIGGAVVNDITYYLDDIVIKYHPRQLVIYVGENDLPDPKVTADTVLERTKRLFSAIRAKLPEVPIVYISIKPSPSRDQFREKARAANRLIQSYLATQQRVTYVDVFSQMLDKEGNSRKELFVADMLHMNKQGYEIWRKAVEPLLLKK
jgi:lysophospholipase L1-like esterase